MDATTAVAPPPTPGPEDKARYDAARKELVQALQKKRLVDRQLVRPFPLLSSFVANLHRSSFCIVGATGSPDLQLRRFIPQRDSAA